MCTSAILCLLTQMSKPKTTFWSIYEHLWQGLKLGPVQSPSINVSNLRLFLDLVPKYQALNIFVQSSRSLPNVKYHCSNVNNQLWEHDVHLTLSTAQSVSDMCHDKQWSTKSGYLKSPHYPQMYPKGMDCACRISANETGSVVAVQTLEYQVTETTPCRDWLYVITEFSSEQLCGPLARHFVGEDVSLLFHSQTDGFKGFLLHYEGRFHKIYVLKWNNNFWIYLNPKLNH